ncbi:MAG: Vgb family protein [Pseudobdellovibrionaceae bacterium]
MWVAERAANKIARLDPTTHKVKEFPVPTPEAAPSAVAVDSAGNAWFTESAANKIGVLRSSTGKITEVPIKTAFGALKTWASADPSEATIFSTG